MKEVKISDDIRIVQDPHSLFWYVQERGLPGEEPMDLGLHAHQKSAERAAKWIASLQGSAKTWKANQASACKAFSDAVNDAAERREQVKRLQASVTAWEMKYKTVDEAYIRLAQIRTQQHSQIKDLQLAMDGATAAAIAANARAYKLEQENARLRNELEIERSKHLTLKPATIKLDIGTVPDELVKLRAELEKVRAKHAAATKLVTELKYQVQRHAAGDAGMRDAALIREKELRATIQRQSEEIERLQASQATIKIEAGPDLAEQADRIAQLEQARRQIEIQRKTIQRYQSEEGELRSKLASRESELQRATRRIAHMQRKASVAMHALNEASKYEVSPLPEFPKERAF